MSGAELHLAFDIMAPPLAPRLVSAGMAARWPGTDALRRRRAWCATATGSTTARSVGFTPAPELLGRDLAPADCPPFGSRSEPLIEDR